MFSQDSCLLCSVLALTRFLSVLFFIAPTAQGILLCILGFMLLIFSINSIVSTARGYMYDVLMYFSTFHDTVVLFGMVVLAIQH